jgi:hypothetical protein
MRAVALALLLAFGAGVAHAQGVPPPPVPQLPDEPLPEWHPPKPSNRHAMFLQMSPEMREDQRLRQIGIWMSSFGWSALLLGGVFYVWASNVNQDLANPPPPMPPGQFSPALEDKRNAVETSALTFLGIGAVLAATGFALYTAGQWRMTVHHKRHPDEPLPPLSGF